MAVVVFRTPTLLDLRALTTFGVNAKPNVTSPIGFFGTGLKYAIAVLCREKLDVSVWIGTKGYSFYTKEEEFRDKSFSFVYMRTGTVKKWFQKETRMPFTTELGKTWELWQAFRELYSNTLDEDGVTYLWPSPLVEKLPIPETGDKNAKATHIYVGGEAFVNEYHDRERTFLPDALRSRDASTTGARVQHFIRPSKYVYYRGLRVLDLDKPSRITYNILCPIDLTEDRTAKYTWQIEEIIRNYIAHSDDPELIQLALGTAKVEEKDTFESRLRYTDMFETPGQTFTNIVKEARGSDTLRTFNPTAVAYVETYDPELRAEKYRINGVPKERSVWRDRYGDSYEVLYVANQNAKLYQSSTHPLIIVYKDRATDCVWAVPFTAWDFQQVSEGFADSTISF